MTVAEFIFYVFAIAAVASGLFVIVVAQPGAFGAVADPRLPVRRPGFSCCWGRSSWRCC